MKVFAVKLSVFLLITYFMGFVLEQLYQNKLPETICNKYDWVFSKKNEKYDVGFLGSSRVLNMLDADTIEKTSKYSAINLGFSGTSLQEQYLILKKLYGNGCKFQKIYLQLDLFTLITPTLAYSYPFHEYEFLSDLSDNDVEEVMRQFKPTYRYFLWKYLPFAKYAEFNTRYSFTRVLSGHCYNSDEATIIHKGFEKPAVRVSSERTDIFRTLHSKRLDTIVYNCDSVTASYADKIIDLAKKNGSLVTVYTAPLYKDVKSRYSNHKIFTNRIKNICEKFNCGYYNYGEDEMCNDSSFFNDGTHLNAKGTSYLSLKLAETLFNKL
ncbi:MAG: hypothetical protein HYX39_12145 [Bacteroidetes bacterium]|nr:hypothetical protein [Bacteroidota bacterium]